MCERFVYMIAVPPKSEEESPTPLYRQVQNIGADYITEDDFDWAVFNNTDLAQAEIDRMHNEWPDTEYYIKRLPVFGTKTGGVG